MSTTTSSETVEFLTKLRQSFLGLTDVSGAEHTKEEVLTWKPSTESGALLKEILLIFADLPNGAYFHIQQDNGKLYFEYTVKPKDDSTNL